MAASAIGESAIAAIKYRAETAKQPPQQRVMVAKSDAVARPEQL
jgi:hypothetical protein